MNLYAPIGFTISNKLEGSLFFFAGVCEYRDVCGGQRGRAYGVTGDYLESDPACIYVPNGESTSNGY